MANKKCFIHDISIELWFAFTLLFFSLFGKNIDFYRYDKARFKATWWQTNMQMIVKTINWSTHSWNICLKRATLLSVNLHCATHLIEFSDAHSVCVYFPLLRLGHMAASNVFLIKTNENFIVHFGPGRMRMENMCKITSLPTVSFFSYTKHIYE